MRDEHSVCRNGEAVKRRVLLRRAVGSTQMTRRVRSILLTGFGPFPGHPHNASGELVRRLARTVTAEFENVHVVGDVLPVDWTAAPERLKTLIANSPPDIAIHFGISEFARGFVIEQTAYNETQETRDQFGAAPGACQLIAKARNTRTSSLPVKRIYNQLVQAGLPATLSHDPGRYLCNALLYHSLALSRRGGHRYAAGFIHIPAELANDAIQAGAADGVMTAAQADRGGLAIVRACLR
jgi:pyroglutamyl-peptidase